jgi:hypothetical protein
MRDRRACADFDRSVLARRRMLQVGAPGTLGLSLSAAWRAEAASGLNVRAESVIFLHQFGGVPQQDTFDMKPKAPAELRGEFQPIPSSVPGRDICDRLPRMAGVMKYFTVVRSVNHRVSQHNPAAYYSLIGHQPLADIVSATASASDSTTAYLKDNPCTPDDISATMFPCLGIDPATELRNHLDQPVPASRGTPILPLLA